MHKHISSRDFPTGVEADANSTNFKKGDYFASDASTQ